MTEASGVDWAELHYKIYLGDFMIRKMKISIMKIMDSGFMIQMDQNLIEMQFSRKERSWK